MRQGDKAWSRQDAVCCHPVCFQVGAVSESGACLECAYCKVLPKSQLDTNTKIRQIWVSNLQTALALVCLSKWYRLNFVVPDFCLQGELNQPSRAFHAEGLLSNRCNSVHLKRLTSQDDSWLAWIGSEKSWDLGWHCPFQKANTDDFIRITSLSLSICPFTDLACCVDRVLSGEFCSF